jgi:hypothetical protein
MHHVFKPHRGGRCWNQVNATGRPMGLDKTIASFFYKQVAPTEPGNTPLHSVAFIISPSGQSVCRIKMHHVFKPAGVAVVGIM